jgi:N-hydroxyarylamine O-acetyltransferase
LDAQSSQPQSWIRDYLGFLEVAEGAPSKLTLDRLSAAHLRRVPFENVTSILRRAGCSSPRVPPIDREATLQAWIERRGGGVCFDITEMFSTLLCALGFNARPVLARITFAGSHQAILVELDRVLYLVDVGNGAPFLEPIPLDNGSPVELRRAGLAYRFRRDSETLGDWVQDRCIEGAWRPFCAYDLQVPASVARAEAYQRHHTRGESWVVDSVRLVRCTEDEVWSLREAELAHFTAESKSVQPIRSPAEYSDLAADVFGLPALPIQDALEALKAS